MKPDSDFNVQLPFGAPPILPDVTKQLQGYLLNPGDLVIHDYESAQQHWASASKPDALYNYDLSVSDTTLKINRNLITGELLDYSEVEFSEAGFTEWKSKKNEVNRIVKILENVDDEFDLVKDLRTTPSIFSRGFDFNSNTVNLDDTVSKSSSKIVNLATLLQVNQEILDLPDVSVPSLVAEEPKENEVQKPCTDNIEDSEIINGTPQEVTFKIPVIHTSKVEPLKSPTSTEWAEILDITRPLEDFHERIPDMAFKYNFELDTFQKQAILKLEENCSVLVSAHTSAGKTVVAEYAIALSQRHMTRTIYTSPIKALSNQKYRDFRKTFQDVGLITGDFQINSTGTCLIVTTEILRAMLLAQNEIVLDLEFVIFDEVHYINDSDRGHVWEEVLILLPQHVTIVMLSATIPNTLQFADWVGRTKRKKIYVVYTAQRPVPLEHYLYTGTGGNSRDERFLILNANNEFLEKGYSEAVEAKAKKDAKSKAAKKGKVVTGRKQEQTMWVALLEHLEKHDKLPVVAFTLSRKRCDENANNLLIVDFLTAKEKFHVRNFFHRSIQRLKEADQNLPQIRQMQQLLEHGIGIHHSGILPILKEIVEILFQDRCVKILFATETFAMGVNMPAKTVVFDSIRKFDGTQPRTLLPSEYIQMAGRAGRRGLDKTGTVLIICKNDIPSETELISMMLGKPRKVESQFRLTYSIILKLERKRVAAERRISVEEMMSNSFKEADHIKKKKTYVQTLSLIEKQLSDLEKSIQKTEIWEAMCQMYCSCLEYLDVWKELSPKLFSDKQGLKYVVPGRIVLVTHKNHVNKLGILLACEFKRDVKFKVLVLDDKTPIAESDFSNEKDVIDSEIMNDTWHKVLSLSRSKKIFVPQSIGEHVILNVDPWDIMEVTSLSVKTDPKIVIGDWDNRQIPRFKDKPPGQTCQKTVEELTEITQNVVKGDLQLEYLNLLKGVRIFNEEHIKMISDLTRLKSEIESFPSENVLVYEGQLKEIFRVKYLEKKRENLKYLLSYKSMSLYPEYQSRLLVLRKLKYIDSNNSVQMKGNVACEMSNHELLITELVLRNALNDLQPAEIAALLSCFVYQGKKNNEFFEVTANLQAGIDMIQEVAKEVWETERECGLRQNEASGNEENLNFELVPVVYEWARGKEFSQIMTLTDVQEGIIVRCIQQLSETIRDVKDAARIIGEPTLQQKMEDACNAIKRDIVFTASLYME
ncbi:UNVERIFIED_CONTAM: hypothetical protein PYX00_007793 [Menopon gallinae]|uniref:Helicase SKI2W n=1 Tax=Menopon gallinae TaxID=328185 RepID=A0AAW2HKH3_9NEOP